MPCLFRAIVFRRAPSTPDFPTSTAILLPGEHTAAAAWRAIFDAMRADSRLIGGEVRSTYCAE